MGSPPTTLVPFPQFISRILFLPWLESIGFLSEEAGQPKRNSQQAQQPRGPTPKWKCLGSLLFALSESH